MKISAKKNVQLFINQCINNGLTHVVISPGSRNAPLTISFNQHPKITCLVIPDERSAAFYALGMAQQLNRPVALLCTSGSASVNYYPAITEAYYQRVPLIVITADRPHAWINEGDGQTIVQQGLFEKHINFEVQIDDSIENEDYQWYIRKETTKAFQAAQAKSQGPVHINFALTEPLYDTVDLIEEAVSSVVRHEKLATSLSEQQIESLQLSWASAQKKMILCGQMRSNSRLLEQLKLLALDASVVILVENTSNLVDSQFIHCIDRTLNSIQENEMKEFAPDIIVNIGGAIVSKRIKSFLRKHKPKQNWKVSFDFPLMDTFQSMTHSFEMDETSFFKTLNKVPHNLTSSYGLDWKKLDLRIQEKVKTFIKDKQNLSDITAFHAILDCIPEDSALHLANSSVVRYAQLFDPIASVSYWSNRGTSGIDGSTSTAAGAAYIKSDKWLTLITGDMSFFYDSNAFWNHVLTPNFRIILVNNGGGGIFKIIPGPDTTNELEDFFVFPNTFQAEAICQAFNIKYIRAENLNSINQQMEDFYTYEENSRPKLMEIMTSSVKNELELKDFFEKIALKS